jgi:hypothetical protein
LIISHPEINFIYEHRKDNSIYRFDTRKTGEK